MKPRDDEDKQAKARRDAETLAGRMKAIRHKIVVLSGKGGVGKSTVAANLARSLAAAGKTTGLLDVDIHGPSVPKLLRLEGRRVDVMPDKTMKPVRVTDRLVAMSIGLLLPGGDDAVIWRGPLKMGVIRQFLTDVAWGELDYLVVDAPPGTGDEPLSVAQLIGRVDGAIVVTTPQELALADVRKGVDFCRQVGVPVIGVVENMSGFVCPHCGKRTAIFKEGGGVALADALSTPLLGKIPLDASIAEACDNGLPPSSEWADAPAAGPFQRMTDHIRHILEHPDGSEPRDAERKERRTVKTAIPVSDGRLSLHFGHCERFALIECDQASGDVGEPEYVTPPPHEPGLLPRWLHEKGADVIIAGGMGRRAQDLFAQNGIEVVVGASADAPLEIARAYLAGTLEAGENVCDH